MIQFNPKVDLYLLEGCGRCKYHATPKCKVNLWRNELELLRQIALDSGLIEEIKWGVPVYTFNNKIRLGNNSDGGYVIADIIIPNYDCYLSCGVSNEESFSRDFINKYNMNNTNSFAFDASIEKYPTEYTDKITWYKKFIGDTNDNTYTTMEDIINKYNNIFMKMDIEAGEYPWFKYISETKLNKFKQIVVELHWLDKPEYIETCKILLEKINKTHYLIHIHGNNNNTVFMQIPIVLEATFVNKKEFISIPSLNNISLPIPNLDYPCDTNIKDINLNYSPFTN
jgi:hypothetical protein